MKIRWQWSAFSELTLEELYTVLRLRQEVFVVEQNCPFLDADNQDQAAWHFTGWDGTELAAYLRILPAGTYFPEIGLGRIVVAPAYRGKGLGRAMMQHVLHTIDEKFNQPPVRISAQTYLENFYTGFGFETVSPPYDEDGILHIQMLRR